MNSKNRRGLDLFAGVFFILFSLWSFLETFKIPMKDTYGGVSNVWYVSPALMPLLINSGLLLLGISLIVFSIKHGALEYIKEWKNHALSQMLSTYFASTEFRRFLFIAMLFLVEVYIFIPHVDFYLSMALFLFIFISFFHLESKALNRITVPLFFGFSALVALLKLVGVMNMINRRFQYIFDAVVLVMLLVMMIRMARCVRDDAEQKKESRKVRNIALLGPFFLIVLFKYLLLIPMPVEGGIISLLNLVYYSIR